MTEVDVIISGLGPTGATLAGLLGQRGVKVAVFDKLPDLFPLPRAAGLDHEVMRVMQELQVADRMAPFLAPYRASEYRGMQGQLIKRLDSAPPPFRLGWAPNHVFNQPAFERVIRARLDELPSVKCDVSADVVKVGQDEDHAWADVQFAATGETTRYRARYLIACDGGSSPIRKQLGIALEDLGFDEPWLVVDAIVNDDKCALLPQTQVQYCEAERPSTFVVGVGNHRRWELMLLPGDSLSSEFPEDELWPLLERWMRPDEGKIWRAAAYRFHGLVASEWRLGRILLAGDAAHMTPPFMAQGMGQGMRDALNLSWKLERVLAGCSAGLLDTYQQERKPHVTATTQLAMALGRVICERDPVRAVDRDARMLAEQGGTVSTTYRQDMIPGLVAGLLVAATPGAGTILPQPMVRAGGFSGRLDDLSSRSVRVVVCDSITAREGSALLEALVPLQGVLIELGAEASPPARAATTQLIRATEEGPLVAPWLKGLNRRFAIVRPDHYVYGTAETTDDAVQLLRQMRQALL